jgi:glutathione S-transferase
MIKLYGSKHSRAARCLWMLEEIGEPYDHIDIVDMRAPEAQQQVMRVNPIGKVPALEDGELKLFESMAINLYLAAEYGARFWPGNTADQGRAAAWSVWGMTEMEPPLAQLFLERVIRKSGEQDEENENRSLAALERPLDALENHLKGLPFLIGETFTVADLNLASVLTLMNRAHYDLLQYPNANRWRQSCYDRPAYRKVYSSS